MINRDKRNRLLVLLIFGMTIIPFAVAWLLGGKASFIKGQVNNGQLITPIVTTKRDDFIGIDDFSTQNIGELKGRWVMLNVVPENECGEACLKSVHKTKQLLLMMNKDLIRIRRVVAVLQDSKPETVSQWFSDDKVLLKIRPSLELSQKLSQIKAGRIPDGMLFLMDPLGNLMMQYDPGFDPYKVKSDLMHLLRISQIG
ncbi:MAG: hypothetical protein IPN42_12710 [Methylococcaceae bacterium]|nr:hypothetical protein [Methylococcaceae bacterium]